MHKYMLMEAIVQTIKKGYDSTFDFAKVYYGILFKLNQIKITDSELNLISYSAVNGTLSTPPVRDQFMKEFSIPKGSFYNMIAKLQKVNILVKVNNKIRINPKIQLDFNKPVVKLNLTIFNKEKIIQLSEKS